MTGKQALKKARKLLSDRKKWTDGALEDNGAFCALGALKYSLGERDIGDYGLSGPNGIAYEEAIERLARTIKPDYDGKEDAEEVIYYYNDSRGYDCTLAAFDKAIEETKGLNQ